MVVELVNNHVMCKVKGSNPVKAHILLQSLLYFFFFLQYSAGRLDVESLGRSVLYFLTKPEQVLIIRELRCVLKPTDIGRFDSMVGPAEVASFEELATRKAAKSAKLSPCNGQAEGPPKKTIMETVPGEWRDQRR